VTTAPAAAIASVLRHADALAKEISAMRGLPLRTAIAKDVVDKGELRRRLIAMSEGDKEADDLARESALLKHWGLIPREVDYRALVIDVLSDQVAGYYDSEIKRLTIANSVGTDADPDWAQMVLAHEIQHALQDQTFDLTKFRDLPRGEDDAATARVALIEGDGIAVMIAIMMARTGAVVPWTDPAMIRGISESLVDNADPSFASLPLVIREQLLFPYQAGFSFVAHLRRQKPWRAVDAAFRSPPVSTEQILHPALYERREAPIPVGKLTAPTCVPGAKASFETIWGELGFSIFLRTHGVDAAAAAAAAAGWGGDRVTLMTSPAYGDIGVARLRWDSEVDALEAYEAAVRALDNWIVGPMIEHTPFRSAWLATDGRVSFIEIRESALVIAHEVPLRAARRLPDDLWRVTAPFGPR
jgi:hypothetical protein